MNKGIKTYGAIILAMIFWAFSFVWYKIANRTFQPVTIVFLRLLIAVTIMTIYLYLTKGYMKIKKGDLKMFLLLSLFEPFLYFIGESYGLTYVSATAGSVLISTIPVFATIGAWIFFKERMKAINYAGILLSFAGVLVFLLNSQGTITYSLKGVALLLMAVITAAGYNLTLSRLVGRYSPVYIVNVQNIIGAILFLPVFLISDFKLFIRSEYTPEMFMPVIALAVFASCGAFILFAFSVSRLGILRANVFTNFIPVCTAVIAFLIMGDRLTLQNYAGMFLVIAGIFMAQLNGKNRNIDEAMTLTGKTA